MQLSFLSDFDFGTWFSNWFTSGWLLAIIFTIFLIDLIFTLRPLGHFAVLLMSAWLCLRFGPWGKWTVFWCIIIFLGVYAVYHLLFATVGGWIANMLQRGAPEEKLHRIVGKVGRIRIVSGKTMFSWDGELWSIQENHPDFQDGEEVKCTAFTEGIAIIEKTSSDCQTNL